ncbi:MAG: rhomboid family intramembrane serine protease [Planctomycetes bacterium]|nr:rhomboid family intramembrane serine protease [Planctomycetota bacterium]
MRRTLRGAHSTLVLAGTLVVLWVFVASRGDLAAQQILDARQPTLSGFFAHQLFHISVWHLLANSLVILVAGAIIESSWGPIRFFVFCAFVALGVAAIDLVAGSAALSSHPDAESAVRSLGASGIALGCLVSLAVGTGARRILPGMTAGALLWSLIFLGAGGLALLDLCSSRVQDPAWQGLVHLPQISGVGFALIYLWALPRSEALARRSRKRREARRRESVRDLRYRVDEILEKISTRGYDSLTAAEKRFLRQASKHYKGS